ncbi:MAG: hypothetical protein GY851_07590 [bacterium]|nr:hypothetical protein [bacterium]
MSDKPEATDTTGQDTTQATTTDAPTTPDPRESKAFKAVTADLLEERKKIEALTKKLEKATAADESRQMAENEKAGKYEDNIKLQLEKLKTLQSEFDSYKSTAEKQATEARIDAALAPHVPSPKARAVLTAEYLGQDEPGELAAWIDKARDDPENAPFFGKTSTGGVPAPRSQGASTGSENTNWANEYAARAATDMSKEGLEAKAAAVKKLNAYRLQHGDFPPRS